MLVVDHRDSYTYNLHQLIWTLTGAEPLVVPHDAVGLAALAAEALVTHVVLSPGPGSPGNAHDAGRTAELIAALPPTVPVLGVCFGHQLLAHLNGGVVVAAPVPMHGRLSTITHSGRRLFDRVPQGFRAVRYHSLVVTHVPADFQVTARSEDGAIMAIEAAARPVFGVQFHPESIATEHGARMLGNFLGAAAAPRRAPERRDRIEVTPRPERLRIIWRRFAAAARPEDVFAQHYGRQTHACWLDSARPGGDARYSYLAAGSAAQVLRVYAREGRVRDGLGRLLSAGPLDLLPFLATLTATPVDRAGCPVPFVGGLIGYTGYGALDPRPAGPANTDGTPDAEYLRCDRVLAFDHETRRWYAIAAGDTAGSRAWLDHTEAEVRATGRMADPDPDSAPTLTDLRPDVDRERYRAMFADVQAWLHRGESYEACLTYQYRGTSPADRVTAYRHLRRSNPAPFGAYLAFGELAVLSSSPEKFLSVRADGRVESKPIKGTIPRRRDDRATTLENFALDEKMRSENLMITDLIRNDLGRVCRPGSVEVPSLMGVETHATVHHLVTTVRGVLRPDKTAYDALAAVFPGGSMVGAPKARTIDLLNRVEVSKRGVYAGSIGYLGFGDELLQSIAIRTIVWRGTDVRVGVGGAIVALSTADDELREAQIKGAATLAIFAVTATADPITDVTADGAERT